MTLKERHMSDTLVPYLSQSIAWTLLSRSPLHAWHEHPMLGGAGREPTQAMETGTLAHQMVLGGDRVVTLDFPDWRTNAAKAARDELRAAGKTPVLRKHIEAIEPVRDSVLRTLADYGIDLGAMHVEERMEWTQDGVLCAGTPDAWGERICLDLKTMPELPSPSELARKMCGGSWPMQRRAYLDGLERGPDPEGAGRRKWIWVLAETEPPFASTIATCDAVVQELGRHQWIKALARWKALLDSGYEAPWKYPSLINVEAPLYVSKQLEDLT